MTRRTKVLGAVAALLAVPVILAGAQAASFYAGASNGTLVTSGEEREYLVHVPDGYRRGRPVPLVISLHGAGGWGALQMATSRWNEAADEHGFIVVYPSALRGRGPSIWRVHRGPDLAKDVRFIAELIDTLSARYDIDTQRVYANGISNGGGMSFVLSCALADRIAAVGLVASALTLEWEWCADPPPMPLMLVHGTADPVTPLRGGTSWMSRQRAFPDIRVWASRWARRNGCADTPLAMRIAPDVLRATYVDCDADVVVYTVEGGGHSWPGGGHMPQWLVGRTSRSISATEEMWTFFREQTAGSAGR